MEDDVSADHDALPLPDYDHLPIGSLASHISALSADEVGVLLDYERAHGNRLPVTQVLEHRLEALQDGAEPSGSLPESYPELGGAARGSKVTEATSGPPINPPSHGDPTNPAQPR
ncbi:hypothetical protein GCM10025866_07100 [Naasia aerilata]|uniref:DUF8129 domain-containing protein n=1 Tax=Naasia aerilata TaxID=1162966 RepID=A0ABN6XIX7_9MICO|nr:hypothetical protein GCM10025866_07100 [Naasia aerilata]